MIKLCKHCDRKREVLVHFNTDCYFNSTRKYWETHEHDLVGFVFDECYHDAGGILEDKDLVALKQLVDKHPIP